MTHIIKKGPIKVPTQPKNYDLQATGLVFKSYDNQIALEFNVAQQDGTPADLLGANLRLLMFVYDEVDGAIKKEPIPFITKNLITESFLNGHVVYILPEAMKAYNGMVEAYVYIEYPDGSTSDNLGFTFRMKRSAIDGLAQDKADYFIEDFKQLLAAASLEANKTIEGLDTEIKNLQQAAKDANAAVDGAMDRIDGLEAEIGQLERLREMYIDTLDCRNYDYSGNPNLMPTLKAKGFKKQSGVTVEDVGNGLKINFTKTNEDTYLEYATNMPALSPNTQYTLSADFTVSEGYTGKLENLKLSYRISPTETTILRLTAKEAQNGKKTKISVTANSSSIIDPSKFDRMYFTINTASTEPFVGTVLIENIKLERGSTVTLYQPNLLAEPYNMCREYPNENIADPAVEFPITRSSEGIYAKNALENFILGETYTVTIGATKPASQKVRVYLAQHQFGDFKPVEGLVDTWVATVSITQLGDNTKAVYLQQSPKTSLGSCTINWLKIEKGNTRTPIDVPTYKGLGIIDTNDPTKYVWNYTELVDVDGIQDALENVEQRTATLEGKANTIDGRLNNVNTVLNTVQSTADQILAEVTAADVMKETDLPSYLANKPIVAGGTADFSDKVAQKVHPNPHKCANYTLANEHASQAPSKAINFETTQAWYNSLAKLDGSIVGPSTSTIGQTTNFAFRFDLISQIAKDFPSFFDDCLTQGEKVIKIRNYIESAVLTIHSRNTNSECYISVAQGDEWGVEAQKGSYNESAVTEKVYNRLVQNLYTRACVQDDGSIIFRARTRAIQASETNVTVKQEVDYVRLDYTLNLSSDDFITPIERDVTKDNLTQILSDDSVMIKGAMDYKFKTRGNLGGCPHSAYLKSNSVQATNMSEITYEADADMYNKIQNKDDGLASVLAPSDRGFVGQAKYKFDLVTAIEKEHPHLFKGLTTTKQKVDVLKAKMQELKFNIWCRTEGATGNIEIGSSLSNVDAIDTLKAYDVGQTTEYALATYHSENNAESAKRINDDGTILYYLRGNSVGESTPNPKVIIDYVNLEYTLSDKPSDYVVAKTDTTYLAAVAKTKELDRYKEYFDKGPEFGTSTTKLTSLEPGTSKALHGTRAVTVSGGTFKATKACRLYFDFSVKFRGAATTPYIYIKVYKNGVEADIEAVAAVGGMRDADGKNVTLKYQTNAPLKYIVDVNVDDTIEFKIDMGDSPNTIQSCRMLYGTIEEI